jgi:hypothetical protein
MAVSPKIPLPPVALMSLSVGSVGFPAPGIVPPPAKLDFVPNPNHCRINAKKTIKKVKSPTDPRSDLSPRLELSLNIGCDTAEKQSPEIQLWFMR